MASHCTEGGEERHTFVAKVKRKEEGTARGTGGIRSGSYALDDTLDTLGQEGSDTQEHESETVEEPREREDVERRQPAEEEPPQDRGDGIRSGDNIQLYGRLTSLASQENDLVRVGGKDLSEREDEGVDGPISHADLEKLLQTPWSLVAGTEQELVVAVIGGLAILAVVIIVIIL